MENIQTKLSSIQNELRCPKSLTNDNKGYKYRSLDDILDKVKPLVKQQGLNFILSDDMVMLGDRYYVKSTAVLTDGENQMSASAYAREDDERNDLFSKAQITGSASTYARKYALAGLFAIGGESDPDSACYASPPEIIEQNKDDGLAQHEAVINTCSSVQALEELYLRLKNNGCTCLDQLTTVFSKRKEQVLSQVGK